MTTARVDVSIVGAGLPGMAAGHHRQARCPRRTHAILEARDAVGGTWGVLRNPGSGLPRRARRASTADARWTVEAERTDTHEIVRLTCGFPFRCTGCSRYASRPAR